MPKIRVTMEAEIGDLSSFWPNDPVGCTTQNVFDVVKEVHIASIERLMDLYTKGDDELNGDTPEQKKRVRDCLENAYRQEKELTGRLTQAIRIDVLEAHPDGGVCNCCGAERLQDGSHCHVIECHYWPDTLSEIGKMKSS